MLEVLIWIHLNDGMFDPLTSYDPLGGSSFRCRRFSLFQGFFTPAIDKEPPIYKEQKSTLHNAKRFFCELTKYYKKIISLFL